MATNTGDQRSQGQNIVRFGTPFNPFTTYSVINSAAGGNIAIAAGKANQSIYLHRILIVVGGATNLTFQDGSTPLSGPMPFTTGGFFILDMQGEPWYSSSSGNALNLNSSNAVQISGTAYYVQA